MTEVKGAISRLRVSGWSNPFLRCFLFVVALAAIAFFYAIPLFALLGALFSGEPGRFEDSLAFVAGMLVQFLAALTAVWLFRRYLDRQSFKSLGFERRPGWIGGIAWSVALGAGLMALSVAILAAFGWVEVNGSGWLRYSVFSVLAWSLSGLVSLIAGAIYEELIFRGYLLQNLAAGSNLILGVLLSSLLFGAVHLANPNATLLGGINTGLAGLFFALLYLLTDSLWAAIGAHFAWNFTQNYVLGLPVSGLDIFASRSPLWLNETGPDIATGGVFGPEGGLVVTAVMVAASLYLYLRLSAKASAASREPH